MAREEGGLRPDVDLVGLNQRGAPPGAKIDLNTHHPL